MQESITVKDLTVSYKNITPFSIKRNLLHMGKSRSDSFTAVDGISFSVYQGEILGIIGKNGSGKSTLLRTMANIFIPDNGTVDLHDQSVSLLSIGVGFNGNLTGRKNIELSGMLLGFPKQVIREKTNAIIEFSELGEFIDRPVRTYSSGMYSKLAFSITACLETDIMLIDEVLSVGDEKFRKKSYGKMKELIGDKNRTVVIVSHSIQTLRELCGRIMWLHDGKIREIGDTDTILGHYSEFMK